MRNRNQDFRNWLKRIFVQKVGEQTKEKPYRKYLFIILAIGIILMIIGTFVPSSTSDPFAVPTVGTDRSNSEEVEVFGQKKLGDSNEMTDYETYYEQELQQVLEHIVGVEDVTVMINLDATETKIFEKNRVVQSQQTDEVDREGGKRAIEDLSRDEQLVILRNGEQETPVIAKTEKPKIRGVLVVAKGVENVKVKQMIIEAITSVLDVPTHRVSVLPKKTKGE